nr:polysaccharide deacetylase family protein [uncultured Flavobacterium sp.]
MSKWFIKTKPWIKWFFKNQIWSVKNNEQKVYLTFDDGPIPEVTPWVLEVLAQHDVKATFFCIGDNVKKNKAVYEQVLQAGHKIGNHTFNHLKGWETATDLYLENVEKCEKELTNKDKLFRPPYGKIKPLQSKTLRKRGFKIIMWDVLSEDYNVDITPEMCLKNVLDNAESGSIIVFHDSLKAYKNLKYALPKTIVALKNKGMKFDVI